MVQVVEVQRVGADRIRVTYEDRGQRFCSDVHRDSGVDLFSSEAFDDLERQFRERMQKGVVFGAGNASDDGPGAENVPIRTGSIWMPVTDDQLRDAGLLPPLPSEPLPPTPRVARWRRAVLSGYWALRWRLAEVIAGQSLDQDEDW